MCFREKGKNKSHPGTSHETIEMENLSEGWKEDF
jgi:hypothetical protein